MSQSHFLIEYTKDEKTGPGSLSDLLMMRITSRFGAKSIFLYLLEFILLKTRFNFTYNRSRKKLSGMEDIT